MGKPRESRQLELPKLDKNGQRRGGKRKGAGRKRSAPRPREKHSKRPALKRYEPIHITLRVLADVECLRRRHLYHAVRYAMISVLGREGFRIVHNSIQGDHLHLIIEAEDRESVTRGLQGFESVAARFINEAITKRIGCKRTGQVFADRYHEEVIRSPRQARNAIKYVLNNWRKHGDPRGKTWWVDPFSSGANFGGWAELADSPFLFKTRKTYHHLQTWLPRTWLLREGWKRAGPISVWDVPGSAM